MTERRQNRLMNLPSCVLLIVGACIGSAIFSVSGLTLYLAGASAIISWIIAAIIFCAYGIIISKLATMYPDSGGVYIFPKRAIGGAVGRVLGYISGWGFIVSNLIAIAFSAIFAGKYICAGFPALANNYHAGLAFALLTVIISLAIILRGGKRSEIIQNILVIVLAATMLLFCCTAFFGGHFNIDNFKGFLENGASGRSGFVSAIPIAMVAYGGCVVIAFMASEVQDPDKNVPRSLFIGLGIVALLYASVIAAIVGTLPISMIKENESLRFVPLFATISHGSLSLYGWLARIISVCSFAALSTTIIALLRVNARAIQAISHEGIFPDSFSRENGRGVLAIPILLMGAIVTILCCLPHLTEFLISLGAMLNVISMTISCVALMAARTRKVHTGTIILAILVIVRLWIGYIPQILKGGDKMWLFTGIVYAVGAAIYLLGYKKANRRLHGVVVHGKGHGNLHSIPTANMEVFEGQTLPKFGVWAVKVYINGREFRGMTNVGLRPSDDDSQIPTVETYILDFDDDLYGSHMTIEFMKYIRETRKFADLDELKVQVDRDIKAAFPLAAIAILFIMLLGGSANFSAQAQNANAKGEFLSLTINDSKIYPGTERTVQVYVPREYNGYTPACLFVRMDGIGHNIPALFDELIASGEMPVTIGVFITAGKVKGKGNEVVRYNRSNEFDRMTGTWAKFLETEVLPKVQELYTSDGRKVVLSNRAADRAINGDSSGGIAAFNAAWQRPDLFSRVYSIVGTFVPMRGGDTFPALIRKTEPKALRIFLQDNDKDSWNLTFGSWYEYNRLMASALDYAGYNMRVKWDEGGHNGTNGGAIMREVLKWLWKGWPEAVSEGSTRNELIRSVVLPGEGWKNIHKMEGKSLHEAVYPGGTMVAKSKPHSACIRTWILDKKGKEQYGQDFYWLHCEGGDFDYDTHIAFDTEGWLYASTPLGIQICDQNGRVRGILSTPEGKIDEFSFVGNRLYIKVGGRYYTRLIGHHAATKDSPAPKSQGQG